MSAVLVVDDDDDIREVMAQSLEAAGFDVITAADGIEALDYLRRDDVDPCLVFLDLNMPRMSGQQLISSLASEGRLDDLHVVVMTAAHTAVVAGARHLLRKPIELDTLLDIAQTHCRTDGATTRRQLTVHDPPGH